jgi:hypothetical protein
MFVMDLIDFDEEKKFNEAQKNKMLPEFKRAAKNSFWSGVHKYAFVSKRFFSSTFSQYCGVFMEKLFFL